MGLLAGVWLNPEPAQPVGGSKLGLISYEAGGSFHVRGMEMAWAGLRQLWGTGRKEGFFYIIQNFSGVTALCPWSKDQLWPRE